MYVSLKIPPGVYRNGTEYQSSGRYYDANFVRWYDQSLGPIGGWRTRGSDTVTGVARAILAWRDFSGVQFLAIGTQLGLFASTIDGTVYDITPSAYTPGRVSATVTSGYGYGLYGAGTYGTPSAGISITLDATMWTLQNWGQDLIGTTPDDGNIYLWQRSTSTKAAKATNSPTCRAVVVTPEGFVFALGTTDQRTVSWCDQQDITTWTPTLTNQAGDYPLSTIGKLMCGTAISGGTLLWTDIDIWIAQYIGGVLVYGFNRLATECGVISPQAVASFDNQVVWMGKNGFWLYNGYVQKLPCDVWDYVFANINILQASKSYAVANTANSEIEFYYCSASSTSIDTCVIWNYAGNYWNIGRTPRGCGADRGAFTYPIKVDAAGNIYEHEVGFMYDGTFPYAEGGPIELANGDNTMEVLGIIQDDSTSGDMTATFLTRFYPNAAQSSYGPYPIINKTDFRFSGRQVSVRYDGTVNEDWRIGFPRLDSVGAGTR